MTNIIVAFSKRENAVNIRNILTRSGIRVSAVCLTGSKVLQHAEMWSRGIVICGARLQDMPYTRPNGSDRADRPFIKRLALRFGNSIGCPTCTYNLDVTGLPIFRNHYQFVIDWDTLWRLAGEPGKFICIEKELMEYRVHEGAATRANMPGSGSTCPRMTLQMDCIPFHRMPTPTTKRQSPMMAVASVSYLPCP